MDMSIRRLLNCICGIAMTISCSAGQAKSMDYGAFEQLFKEPVTTSVTGTPQRVSEVPVTMVIVTAEDIRRSGANDIPGVLRHVAGVDVLQWANDDADVSIRGYNQAYSPRLLVLIDGRQVYADYYGYTPWSTLPVELGEIRQIEVIKGPNSALFGFNAAGGVINIITYNPLYDEVNSASVVGGTQELKQGSVIATKTFKNKGGIRIAAGTRGNNDFSTPQMPNEIGTRRGENRNEINVNGRVRLTDKIEAAVEASQSNAHQTDFQPGYEETYARYWTKSLKGSLSADTLYGLIQATVYKNAITYRSYLMDLNTVFTQEHNDVTVAMLEDLFKIGANNTFRVAAEYRHNMMPTITTPAYVFYNVASANGMWNWKITPSLALTNALRLDHLTLGREGPQPPGSGLTNANWNNRALTEKSFNSAIVWQATDVDTLRVMVSRGVQLPNLIELGGLVYPVQPFGYAGGIPSLNPTIVTNYEVGWDRKLSLIQAQTRVNVFHEISQDLVSLVGGSLFPPTPQVSTPVNVGNSYASGVELSIKGIFLEYWRWGASYTPEVIHDHLNYTLQQALADYQDTLPVNVVNANLGWSRGPWELDSYLRYESNFFGIRSNTLVSNSTTLVRINNYVSVDARIAYKITKEVTVALSGQNITQSSQQQTSAPNVERRVLCTLTVKV
jgi:outer membrane receptor for ferrienterochelin and colicins